MARIHSRRKRRAAWFPGLGEAINVDGQGPWAWQYYSHYCGSIHQPAGAVYDAEIISLTWDYPAEVEFEGSFGNPGGNIPSLADFQGSAWQLEGIKGSIRAVLQPEFDVPNGTLQKARRVMCAAYFEVLKVDPEGGAPLDLNLETYSTFDNDNRRDPYIWQRSWILGRDLITNGGISGGNVDTIPVGFPCSNMGYESALTGSLIDAKSKRFIGPDERLFFGIEMVTLGDNLCPLEPTENDAPEVEYDLDIRLLGRLRRSTNRRSASR